MNDNLPCPWETLAAEGGQRLRELRTHVRQWAARHHVATRCRHTPGRAMAALDATGRPPRVGFLRGRDHTQRELAEATADDLWDAAAVVWAMVNNAGGESARLHHVVAELQETGRWLAAFPVHTAGHDRAMAELFAVEAVA
jgi:hypothetical protein